MAVLVAASVLALALPAQAKMEATAFIQGPGLPGGSSGHGSIRLGMSARGGYPLLSGMFFPSRYVTDRPTGPLGPRYEVRVEITIPDQPRDLVQQLYPYARGGPVLFTPPGQRFLVPRSGGWYRAPARLIRQLKVRGLPERSPISAPPAEVAAPADANGPPPIAWAVALLAGLLVAAAVAIRRQPVR
jgi:hypothetical protein